MLVHIVGFGMLVIFINTSLLCSKESNQDAVIDAVAY